MFDVFTMCTGDKYSPDDVYCLQEQVGRNFTMPHLFKVITDRSIPGMINLDPPTSFPGWWGKVGLFRPGVATRPSIWLDLDVVITGYLDGLAIRYCDKELSMPWNWAQSGHGGCQSSVMFWRGNSAHRIWRDFPEEQVRWPPSNAKGHLWGDQEWITVLRDQGRLNVTQVEPGAIASYKYHCRAAGRPPESARVVVFHGEPKPAECAEEWIRLCRNT